MHWLIDTSVLVRTIHSGNPLQDIAVDALAELRLQQHDLCVIPQNLIEFWAVATRPRESNGLGLSTEDVASEIDQIKALFVLKDDSESIYEHWEDLVKRYRVVGKNSHDARIVAAMENHGIQHLLTFNVSDFQRYSEIIRIFTPQEIAAK
jgi:predicted nucleic acid-binding protein